MSMPPSAIPRDLTTRGGTFARAMGILTVTLCTIFSCSRRPPAPLAVNFVCHFDGHDSPVRIGVNLAANHAMLAVSDDAFVDLLPVAKGEELALLPGGQEQETPQVRINVDGAARLRTKVYPSRVPTEYAGKCEQRS